MKTKLGNPVRAAKSLYNQNIIKTLKERGFKVTVTHKRLYDVFTQAGPGGVLGHMVRPYSKRDLSLPSIVQVNGMLAKGGETVVKIYPSGGIDSPLLNYESFCSLKDAYDRVEGLYVALKKAENQINKLLK